MKEISLSQGKVALVDDADYEWLNQWKWTYHSSARTGYAYRNVYCDSQYTGVVYMHRAILMPPFGMETDHINHDGLDNRRFNLRSCTRSQNMANSRKQEGMTSQYKGVCWSQAGCCWKASIQAKGQHLGLGHFDDAIEAAIAYNYAAQRLHGEYAHLNLVPDRSPLTSRWKKRSGKTSRYVGVSWSKKAECWRAEIRVNYKLIWLGAFDSEEEAARAWNMAALKYRGAKTGLNVL